MQESHDNEVDHSSEGHHDSKGIQSDEHNNRLINTEEDELSDTSGLKK